MNVVNLCITQKQKNIIAKSNKSTASSNKNSKINNYQELYQQIGINTFN